MYKRLTAIVAVFIMLLMQLHAQSDAILETETDPYLNALGAFLVIDEDESAPAPEPVPQVDSAALDAKIDAVFKQFKTVGGAVVVYKGDELVYQRYYGYARKKEDRPVTKDTYFRVASVTKLVTGIGAMQLVEQDKLLLDGDLSDFFNVIFRNPKYPNNIITLRMLMTHTSGLVDSGGFRNRKNGLSMIFTKKQKSTNFKKEAPGMLYSYSNFGAGIVGAAIEKASGQSVNAYMKDHVFSPLGLDAAYHVSYLSRPDDITDQHSRTYTVARYARNVLRTTYEDTADYDMHYRTTAGDLFITAPDMGKLLAMLNGGGTYDGIQILKKESVDEIIAKQYGRNGITFETRYGLFCQRFDTLLEGKLIYGHQGISEGMLSNCFFDPTTGFAMAMLTNGASRARDEYVSDMGRSMFNTLYAVYGK